MLLLTKLSFNIYILHKIKIKSKQWDETLTTVKFNLCILFCVQHDVSVLTYKKISLSNLLFQIRPESQNQSASQYGQLLTGLDSR